MQPGGGGGPGELEERGEVWGLGTRSDGFPLPRPDTDFRPDTGSAQVRRGMLTHLSVLFQMANGIWLKQSVEITNYL